VNAKALKPACHLLKYELLLMADYADTVINMSMTYTIMIAAVSGTSPGQRTVHVTPKRNGYQVLNLFHVCHLNDL